MKMEHNPPPHAKFLLNKRWDFIDDWPALYIVHYELIRSRLYHRSNLPTTDSGINFLSALFDTVCSTRASEH